MLEYDRNGTGEESNAARYHSMLVVIPAHNSATTLPACLEGATAAVGAYPGARLVVVDHASTDGTAELLRSRFAGRVEVLLHEGGTISAVRNAGAASGDEDVIVFLDSDCVVDVTHLFAVADAMAVSRAVAVGCPVDLPVAPHWIEATWHDMHVERSDAFVRHINSGNFAVRRDAFSAVGGFDEAAVTGEDAELCQRLRMAGGRLYRSRSVRAVHLRNPKSLAQFFRKEVWHGLGMFSTVSRSELDRPTLAMAVHLLFLCGALLAPWTVSSWTPASIFVWILMPWVVPVAAVSYRARGAGPPRWPLRAMLLYQLYFLARIAALFCVVRNSIQLVGRS